MKLGATVSGVIFCDYNNDDTMDPPDELVPGATVELILGGTTVDTTTSDDMGIYGFVGLDPTLGVYTIKATKGSLVGTITVDPGNYGQVIEHEDIELH